MTRLSRLAVTVLAVVLVSGAALAHRNATGIVKQRMDSMTAMGDAMKVLRAMMRGSQAYDAERVKAHAQAIARHAGEKLTSLFPEGSLNHPTRAKPAIWTDWDRFAESARQLATHADALAATAFNDQAPQDALFERLRQTCSDCHRAFRRKK